MCVLFLFDVAVIAVVVAFLSNSSDMEPMVWNSMVRGKYDVCVCVL